MDQDNSEDKKMKKLSRVYIIHAGEEKEFLKQLSDTIENVVMPESSCEYRRSFNTEDNIGKEIVKDVNQFVASCSEQQNKCMIIMSKHFTDALTKSQIDNIKNTIDYCFKEGGVSNFVLLKMEENNMFNNKSKFSLTYDQDLKKVAMEALNIWFKRYSDINDSGSNGGDNGGGGGSGGDDDGGGGGLLKWMAIGAVVGVTVVATGPALLGFGAAGIVAGSPAAAMMSASAVASGGGVVAGGLVAVLQSAGAVGLTVTSAVAGASGGVAVAAVGSRVKNWFRWK